MEIKDLIIVFEFESGISSFFSPSFHLSRGLTEVAGEGGTDCPPQKFLSSQKFRHLLGLRNMPKKFFKRVCYKRSF